MEILSSTPPASKVENSRSDAALAIALRVMRKGVEGSSGVQWRAWSGAGTSRTPQVKGCRVMPLLVGRPMIFGLLSRF